MKTLSRWCSGRSAQVLLVACFYLAVALIWHAPLLGRLSTHSVLYEPAGNIASVDQYFSISIAARNAAAILDGDPSRLINQNLCYPTPMSAALGEHGIELGLLAVPGYLLTGNPLVAYNTACLLILMIGALSAFLLVRHLTGDPWAGFVAGLLFAFHPTVSGNLVRPFVMGLHWIPLALYALERLLDQGRLRHAVLMAIAGTLQIWVGSYPLITFACFAGPYGAVRLLQRRSDLDRRCLLLLSAAVLVMVGSAISVLAIYSHASQQVGVLMQRALFVFPISDLLPGHHLSVGALALLLAAVAVWPLGSRVGPVCAFATATLACAAIACSVSPLPNGPVVALYPWLAKHFPFLGIARVPGVVSYGACLGVALLGALGVARIRRHLAGVPALAFGVAAAALVLIEAFHPTLRSRVFTRTPGVMLIEREPAPSVLDAYNIFDHAGYEGPIIDLPYGPEQKMPYITQMPLYALFAAYHGRQTAACFSSHHGPSYYEVMRMASLLPDPRGLVELAASGLRNVVVHASDRHTRNLRDGLMNAAGLETLQWDALATAYRIDLEVETHGDPRQLTPVGAATVIEPSSERASVMSLKIKNRDPRTWALPRPLRFFEARVRWWPRDGGEPTEWIPRPLMLPLALASGQTAEIRFDVGAPPNACDCILEIEVPEIGWQLLVETLPDTEAPGAA